MQRAPSRLISILLRHTNSPIPRRERIEFLPLLSLVPDAQIVLVGLEARLPVFQATAFASIDSTQGHHSFVLERAAHIATVRNPASRADIPHWKSLVFAIFRCRGFDAADVPEFKLIVPDCG